MVLLHQFWNSVMICRYLVLCKQYDCWQVRYLWDQKKKTHIKVILAFIHYIYTTYAIAVKLHDVRTRTRCFGCWNLCLSHQIRYSTHTINICCQKENRLFVVPLAICFLNNVNHFYARKFSYLLSISAFTFDLHVLLLWL